jgi:hypothetical protein
MAGERGKRRKRRPKGKPDNPAQSKRFIEAAKALGLDGDGKDFNRAMDSLAKKLENDTTGKTRRKAMAILKKWHPPKSS